MLLMLVSVAPFQLEMAPPEAAELPLNVLSVTVSIPMLTIAPPEFQPLSELSLKAVGNRCVALPSARR